jgi:hypothetical protein
MGERRERHRHRRHQLVHAGQPDLVVTPATRVAGVPEQVQQPRDRDFGADLQVGLPHLDRADVLPRPQRPAARAGGPQDLDGAGRREGDRLVGGKLRLVERLVLAEDQTVHGGPACSLVAASTALVSAASPNSLSRSRPWPK